MEIWGAGRVGDLTALTTAAMPAEALSADELLACCWDDPGVVLGPAQSPPPDKRNSHKIENEGNFTGLNRGRDAHY